MNVDVAVVGAGLAGLSAARAVADAGLECVVLEARDRVGGRTWSQVQPDGTVVDLGGQWIGPTQHRMMALVAELGIALFPTYDQGETQRSLGGKDAAFAKIGDMFADLDAMAATLPQDRPWEAAGAAEWDGLTFQSWLRARFGDANAQALARLVTSALFTAEPEEISLLHVLVYIRSAGSIALLTEVPGGAQEQRFVKGAQEVSRRLAEKIGAGRVRLSAPVHRIAQDGARAVVEAEGLTVEARRVIVAVPIAIADRIRYAPPLPGHRAQLNQRVAPGATIKIHCIYERPFWRERGLNGRLMYDAGPITVSFDNSPAEGGAGVLVGFVEADYARAFARLDDAARRRAVIDCFVRFFGEEAANPIGYVEANWSNEEWTRGCYGANFPPGAWTRYGWALREPFDLLHWAGAETSPIWMNYMEGAVHSGERAAAEVVAALKG
jgi:monoamine oxidase